jgi:thiamine biosynthesis lipoprotein
MGTRVHLIVVGGPPGLVERARRRIDALESLWSRFRPQSDVSRLNLRAGTAVRVAPETVDLVERAVDGWHLTAGAFDPTMLGAVIRAGYDRTFASIPADARPGRSDAQAGCEAIEIGRSWVRLPAGTGFDPGGIGKGLAADMVTDELIAAGARGACVNLGGDLRVTGDPPGGAAWTVAVDHPSASEPIVRLGLGDGAVATSTTLRRRWSVDGEARHHLIDPATGVPSAGGVTLATVVTARAWAAEVLAKAVLVAGEQRAFDVLAGTGASALAVDSTGRLRTTPGLAAFLER